MKRTSLTLAAMLSIMPATIAHAQFGSGIVLDPTQSAHAITQIEHEERSISNQVQQIENGQQIFSNTDISRLLAALLFTTLGCAQSDQIVPNENLAVESVPPIPSSLATSVERYGNYRGASLASWHPERREMLISTRFADVPEIHLVKMPGGDRSQLTV